MVSDPPISLSLSISLPIYISPYLYLPYRCLTLSLSLSVHLHRVDLLPPLYNIPLVITYYARPLCAASYLPILESLYPTTPTTTLQPSPTPTSANGCTLNSKQPNIYAFIITLHCLPLYTTSTICVASPYF